MGTIGIRRNGRDPVEIALDHIGRDRVLAFAALPASNRRTELFAAYRTDEYGTIGAVVLVDLDGPYVKVKPQSEDMGPYTENRCPHMILALLNPEPPGGYAAEWRKRQRPPFKPNER
jgi:hypothetical protein